jgi:hypothetical protein
MSVNIPLTPSAQTQTSTHNLGGPFQGYSARQTTVMYKDSENVMARRILRKAWNTPYAVGVVNGKTRAIGEFRAVNNLGDFLSRQNYVSGGPNQINKTFPGKTGRIGSANSQPDGTGISASSCNPRFVPDSSDYITYKRQRAQNRTYNDVKNGGDQHNASYSALMAIRRF